MNANKAIEKWILYRDGHRVVAVKPDEWTVDMGPDTVMVGDPDPNHYAWCRVEEGIGSLCKLRSQRETIVKLLVHVHAKGLPVRCFTAAQFGWNHEDLLQNTLDAVYSAIEIRLKEVPEPQWAKDFEVA
jgi:hypothetical protein